MDKNEKCRQLPVIKTQESAWKGGTLSDGTIQLPYPVYSEEVHRWIHALYDLELTDKNYLENAELLKGKPIETLTRDEILTRMTFLVRAERFCDGTIEAALRDGTIEAALRDGTLEALSTRLQEITK